MTSDNNTVPPGSGQLNADRLADFLTLSPDIFWECDQDAIVRYISPDFFRLFPKRDDVIGQKLQQLFAQPSCADDWDSWLHNVMAARTAYDMVPACLLVVDDETQPEPIYLQIAAKPMVSADAGFKGWRGIIRDISREATNAINAELVEQQLSDTIESIPYGVAVFDADDKLIFINNKSREVFPDLEDMLVPGTAFQDLIRANFERGVQGTDARDNETLIQRRLSLHRRNYGTREIELANGRWVELSEHVTSDGGTVLSWSDITPNKRREHALASLLSAQDAQPSEENTSQQAAERAAKALASAFDCRWAGIVRLDADAAHSAHVVALWDADHFVDPSATAYNMMESPCQHVYAQTQRGFEMSSMPDTAHCPLFGNQPMAYYYGYPVRNGKNKVIGHAFIAHDEKIPRQSRRHLEEVFQLVVRWLEMEFHRSEVHKMMVKALEQAEGANRSKSEFLANVSHELRTPLNAIIGFSEMIRDGLVGPQGSAKYAEYIHDIHGSGMHLMELINDILDLSKAEAGSIEGQPRETNVGDTIQSCLKVIAPKAQSAQVKVYSDLQSDMPLLWIDSKHLRQVITNILSNAVKFTPEGGEVTISTQLDEEGLAILIHDTGIGMAPEDIPKALSPFGQIDSSLARKYNGTGLGLPLTKRLVENYDGALLIDSALGDGTTITIRFPAQRLIGGNYSSSHAAE